MSEQHVFMVGEAVAVCVDGKPRSKATVTKVRQYKHRTKVTTDDNSEYDASGYPWANGYSRFSITAMNDEVLAALQHRRDLNVIEGSIAWLSVEEAAAVASLLRSLKANRVTKDNG